MKSIKKMWVERRCRSLGSTTRKYERGTVNSRGLDRRLVRGRGVVPLECADPELGGKSPLYLKVGCADKARHWHRDEQGPVFREGCRWRWKKLCCGVG